MPNHETVPRPHPIRGVLAMRRTTIRAFGAEVGCNPNTLGRVVNGHIPAWPALRRRCAERLGLPERELFADGAEADE
jgi:hypothetical protein